MEDIEFIKIHNLFTDGMHYDNDTLELIGKWYYKFLCSEEKRLSLYVPFYDRNFTVLAFQYIRTFTIVFNLLKEEKCEDFENKCLFSVFQYQEKAKQNIKELTLDFDKSQNGIALWGSSTLTRLDTFLPVFNKSELLDFNDSKTINNSFKLFRNIRESGIINHPQQISLSNKVLTFNNLDKTIPQLISERLFPLEQRIMRQEAIEEKKELGDDFINQIVIQYPYSIKPTFPLTEVGLYQFNLIFKNRYSYNEIVDTEVVLLKNEILNKSLFQEKISFNVIETNHSKELYFLFKDFKEKWASLDLNKYTTPFPKYWFLFINKSLTTEEWLYQFKLSYPSLAEKPIIVTVEKIISLIIETNWIEENLKNSNKLFFPELKSLRKKRLEFVFNNFKNYVSELYSNIKFINENDFSVVDNVIILDSFNIIDIINRVQHGKKGQLNVTVPDFLYYGYQPWIKYHLFEYNYSPLLLGSRQALDENFKANKDKIEELKHILIKGIKTDYKNYCEKYDELIIEQEIELVESDILEENLEYSNEEEIEVFTNDNVSVKKKYIIGTCSDKEIHVFENEKIYLQRDSLIQTYPTNLRLGDFFILNSSINDIYNASQLYKKLEHIPDSVINFQKRLYSKLNPYKNLKAKGISYHHQSYFDNNYVLKNLSDEVFRIPRRKRDWSIICEYLNISHSDQQLAFIAYYGRSSQNCIREMYKEIISFLTDNDCFGTMDAPSVLNSAIEIVKRYNNIFKTEDIEEIKDIAETILLTIIDGLEFHEVKEIKILEDE